jgi:glutamine synthetase type III
MKRDKIKNIEEANKRLLGENKIITEANDYTSNLGRADNEKVDKLMSVLPEDAKNAIGQLTDKVVEALKGMEGIGEIDPSTRDIAVLMGSIAYRKMG